MRMLVAVIWAVPFIAVAQDVPRMLKGMEKGQWRMEMLEHSEAKKGRQMPAMTMCSDNLMKDTKERQAGKKAASECKQRLLKDTADEAVMEMSCPKRTVTTTMKRESPKSMLVDIESTGQHPMTGKMRYTYMGPCKEGQSGITLDKNSEQCKKVQAGIARMDPAKQCASAGANREQCEQQLRQQIAQMKAMCS